jgi:hypothetical protein
MPRKTRILHGEDEYLFVDAPGDEAGPVLMILARPDNPRAVAAGMPPTHQSEHGQWCPVARFDGETLLLAPDPPAGLAERLHEMLPRYAELQRQRIAQAKNGCWYVLADGRFLHALHPAQPGGLLLRLFRDEARAQAAIAPLGGGRALPTGELREFLELRAEEGFAGALLDDTELVYFFLDEQSHVEFVKVRAVEGGRELESELLDARGRWQFYEGSEELDALNDPERWDRLMRRVFGPVPFVGAVEPLSWFAFERDDQPLTVEDDSAGAADGARRIAPLFADAAAAAAWRLRESPDGEVEPVEVADLRGFVARATELGAVVRLAPGDHRGRGGTLWTDETDVLLDSFSGLWRSRDGRSFEPIEE